MSVLFGLYQPEQGEIRKNGEVVKINNPNDATALGIGMVHQHFKLIDVFTVLDNIILGAETTRLGFLQKKEARAKVQALSEKYGLKVDLDAKVEDITHASIRHRGQNMSHIPEDRHKHGLVLDFTLEQNMVLQTYLEPRFEHFGFIDNGAVRQYAEKLIEQYDVRSGQGPVTIARSMSGGNQQKAIVARELDKQSNLLVAVQPTRGLDVGAIEYIHGQLVAQRDAGKAVLLVSLELDEVMSLSDRILVMYEGEIVGELDPKATTVQELGLYMAGAKRAKKEGEGA